MSRVPPPNGMAESRLAGNAARAGWESAGKILSSPKTKLYPSSQQEVDLLLYKWDAAAKQLEIAEAAYETSDCTTRPMTKIGGCFCCGGTQASTSCSRHEGMQTSPIIVPFAALCIMHLMQRHPTAARLLVDCGSTSC